MKSIPRTTQLRRLITDGCLTLPGVFNAAMARLVERSGFSAAYISGAGLANATAGVPDLGLLSLAETVQLAAYIAAATRIPVLADADTGFGGLECVARTVSEFERIGLAGMHLEDQEFPKRCGHLAGKTLVPSGEFCFKISTAIRARQDRDFMIVARTDARSVEGFEAAVSRANKYIEAGADAIFPEALESASEFREFARRVKAPLLANMTEFGKSPLLTVKQLARMGYRMAIYPQTAFRVSMKSAEACLHDLKRRGSQRAWLNRMQTRADLYDLLKYDPSKSEWTP